MSSNSLNLRNVRDGIYNNLYLFNENGGLDNIRDLLTGEVTQEDMNDILAILTQKATINNPRLTGNVGINLLSYHLNDSALFIRGQRNDNPQSEGIRMGFSSATFGSGLSYGIELCSNSNAGSTIDFTYIFVNPASYYAGRILFDNLQGNFRWYARTTPATTEFVQSDSQMRLDSSGTLFLQTRLNTPAITLGATDLATILGEKANTANPSFTGTVSAPGVTINSSSTSFSNLVTFTGGTSGLSKSSVALDNVDNTSDLNKPISTATQTALNTKANTASPTFTTNLVLERSTGDTNVHIRTLDATSNPSVLFTSNISPNVNNGRLLYYATGQLQFRQNNTATNFSGVVGFDVYPNGVFGVGSKTNNKTLVVFENGNVNDDPSTASNFYGFGYNTGLLRYQTPSTGNSHKFFTGLVESLSVNATDMYFGDPSGSAAYPNPTLTTKRLTIDCPVSGGTPYLTMKSRNQATAELALTNATWLFASKTNSLNIVFQTLNSTGTASNVMTMTGNTGQVSFLNNIVVNGTTVTSDRRLKDNIQDVSVDDCLHIFNNLKVKSFDWKRTGRPSLGFIAQEVEEILPLSNNYDIVSESEYQPTPDDEPTMIKTVDYTKLNTMLYVVIKEQQKRIDSLETKLANIEKLLSSPMNI